MLIEKIDLYDYYGIERPKGGKGYLTCYIHEHSDEYCKGRLRPAMIVVGGGAYLFVSDREKEPVAIKYLAEGFNSFVLDYSCEPIKYPYQFLEGVMATRFVKENAKKYHVIKNKVAMIGFSAGGHLAGTVATLYNNSVAIKYFGKKVELNRPDAMVFSYPVVTLGLKTHGGTADRITGGDKGLKEYLSVDKHVTDKTPPAFIWTTKNDNTVPYENSLMLFDAYKKSGAWCELKLFEKGVHGLSLATKETAGKGTESYMINEDVSAWFACSMDFLHKLGFYVED